MTLDPAGLEAAAKALGEVYGGRMAEDAPAAEAAVSAYLAAVVPVTCPECGTEVPPRYSPEASGWYCGGCARPVARDPVPVTPTTENPTARQVLAEAFDGVIHHACGPDDWAAGHALDALAAAGFSVVAGRAAATPDPLTFDSLARAALLPAASADKGWSPGIDDPEPPALGDIDTGEGWYQT